MDEKKINSHSTVNNPQVQQVQQTEHVAKPLTWNGRIISAFKGIKNKIFGFFLNILTGKGLSKATPANIPDNLRVQRDTSTENSKVGINKSNAKLAIKGLKQKGFSSKEAKGIIEQISSQNILERDIMAQIVDVPEKKYYHKYKSHSQIANKVSDSLQHFEELGYDSKKYNKFIYSLLDKCNNFDEFDDAINDIPTFKEHKLGYDSASDVNQDKEIYLKNLQDNGYNADAAKLIIDKAYEEETSDKNNILTKILQTPTVKMRDQGYSNQDEYIKLNDEYTQKLKAKIGGSKEAYNIVTKEQEQASSKQEFINNIEKRLDDYLNI